MVVSCTLPPVNPTTRTRPAPSVSAWTLVVSPPRDRPIAWSSGSPIRGFRREFLSFGDAPRAPHRLRGYLRIVGRHGRRVAADPPGGGPVLVHPHDGGVHRDQPVQLPGGVGLGLIASQQLGPRAIGAPASQSLIGGLPGPEPLGQLPPRCTGAVLPADRLDHLPVITPPPTPTTRRGRLQRRHPRPRLIGDHGPMLAHESQPADFNREDPPDTP